MKKETEDFSPSYEGEHPAKAGEGVVNDGTTPPLVSIQAAQNHITSMLVGHSDAPELDADRILLHVLDKQDASYLLAHSDEVILDANLETILHMTEQRKTGMPLAYILGHADFYGRTFLVTPDVLIPRPDTEALVEQALQVVSSKFKVVSSDKITIVDLCTGSGIIAITLALELQKPPYNLQLTTYNFIATDISPAALEVAKQNAEKHGVLDNIEFLRGDLLEPIKNKHVDLIVSNPPYVPTEELRALRHPGLRAGIQTNEPGFRVKPGMTTNEKNPDAQGLLFEPHIALDGGEDGLQFVNQIKKYSQANNIPAIIETIGGAIITPNKKGE